MLLAQSIAILFNQYQKVEDVNSTHLQLTVTFFVNALF